jgi:hypothetical protein
LIDQKGRVADYAIVAGKSTPPQELRDLRSQLLFTEFDPATLFGQPTQDTLLLSFGTTPR